MKWDIPNARTALGIEKRLQHFIGGDAGLGVGLSQVLIKLNEWASAILAEDVDALLGTVPLERNREPDPDLIHKIAVHLTENVDGMEAEFLLKSVQEVLFQIAGTDVDLTAEEIAARVHSFLRRRGTGAFLRRFLSFHLFNIVWFKSADCFRTVAWTQESFLDDMEKVERVCHRIVGATWRSAMISGPLDGSSAIELVERLGRRLTGSRPG